MEDVAIKQEYIEEDANENNDSNPPPKIMSDDKKAKVEAKKELFEKERDEILKELPDSLKNRFGQIFFTKWSKDTLPVLVMSPFSVAPGPVRNMWYDMFEKVCTTFS